MKRECIFYESEVIAGDSILQNKVSAREDFD